MATTAAALLDVMATTMTMAPSLDFIPSSSPYPASESASPTPSPPGGGGGGPPRAPPPDYLLHTQFVCDRVLNPLVVSFGIVGNLLSLVVLTRKEMTSPTNCFLTALAISDLSLLLLQVPMFFGLNSDIAATDSFTMFVRYYTVIIYVMTNVFLTCTCWLTVAVTVERFLSLRFMMHPKLVCSTKRAKRAILAIFFASFLFHFSKFFEYVPNTDLSSKRPLLPTQLSLNKAYDVAIHIANITLAVLLPVVALVVFNTFLIYFLATHRRRMLKHKTKGAVGGLGPGGGGSTSVDMLHVSGVVIAVVLVFVVCHSLSVFVALNIAVHGRHKIFSNHLFVAFKHVNGLLVMVNSSVNFLIYCSISRKFRKMFAAVFCQHLPLARNKASSWSLPVPLSENSMATAVSIRVSHANATSTNGYSRSGNDTGGRPSPTNSCSASASRSIDHVEI